MSQALPLPSALDFDGIVNVFDYALGGPSPTSVLPASRNGTPYNSSELALITANAAPFLDALTTTRLGCTKLVEALNEIIDGYNTIKALGGATRSGVPPAPLQGTHADVKITDLDAAPLIISAVVQFLSGPIAALAGTPAANIAPMDLARRLQG